LPEGEKNPPFFKEQDDKTWRALADKAAHEPDPVKLFELVNQLCDALDRRDMARNDWPNPYMLYRGANGFADFLKSAIATTEAKFATVQLFDSASRALRLVGSQGFGAEFNEYFGIVRPDSGCSCGAAMASRQRVISSDLTDDPRFGEDDRAVLLRANVRSVQSTPLIDVRGKLIGAVSTHSDRPGAPTLSQLENMDALARSFIATLGSDGHKNQATFRPE
jgi:GAF domain-containing protein